MNDIEKDKKFALKIITKGGVEADVFIKRYDKYIWGIINKKVSDDNFPHFLKKDLYQYIIVKIFNNDCDALTKYVENYSIPLKNYLSLFVTSRITDFIRKEIKQQKREKSVEDFNPENKESLDIENSSQSSAYNLLELRDLLQFFEQFCENLDKKNNDIFRLMIEGLGSKEISQNLDLELKDVYRYVFQLKKNLKQALKDEYK